AQVRTLVAHEAPVAALLSPDEAAFARAQQEAVETAHRTSGLPAAMQRFLAMSGFDRNDHEPDAPLGPPTPERIANLELFLSRDPPAVRGYEPCLGGVQTAA